ncbi:MAG: hypothetical protein G01um101417_440 [Parcubacteria group bacterium Gr01-1014_17]|nr:MAG: hypothetical protein G01um101417_440 [Parcubacteria group bacterium Gr01-1014_17]
MSVIRKGHVLYKLWINAIKTHRDTLLKDIQEVLTDIYKGHVL